MVAPSYGVYYIHDKSTKIEIPFSADNLTPEIIDELVPPFRVYHKHYNPTQIEDWFAQCYEMKVPNKIIIQMMNEDPRERPRLLYVSTDPDADVFQMICEHDDDGPPPFEIDWHGSFFI